MERNPSILIVAGNNNDVLVCYGEYDMETKGPQTAELISSLSKVMVKQYPVSYFAVYESGVREGIIADQIDFLKKSFLLNS